MHHSDIVAKATVVPSQFYFLVLCTADGSPTTGLRGGLPCAAGIAAEPVSGAASLTPTTAGTVEWCLQTPRAVSVPAETPRTPTVLQSGCAMTGTCFLPTRPTAHHRALRCTHCRSTGTLRPGMELAEGMLGLNGSPVPVWAGSPTAHGDKCTDGWFPLASSHQQAKRAAPRHEPQRFQPAQASSCGMPQHSWPTCRGISSKAHQVSQNYTVFLLNPFISANYKN